MNVSCFLNQKRKCLCFRIGTSNIVCVIPIENNSFSYSAFVVYDVYLDYWTFFSLLSFCEKERFFVRLKQKFNSEIKARLNILMLHLPQNILLYSNKSENPERENPNNLLLRWKFEIDQKKDSKLFLDLMHLRHFFPQIRGEFYIKNMPLSIKPKN